MDFLKKYFPLSFKAKEVKDLIINIIIYIVVDIICGVVIGLLAALPIIGIIFSVIGSVVGLYATVGIVLALLAYFDIIK